MKRLFFILASSCFLTLSLAASGWCMAVYCTNCSNNWTQAMERVTNLDQLKNLMGSYREAIEQTQQQIALVQNNIKQYENMLQNTKNLPAQMLGEIKGKFSELAKLTNQLKLQKGDYMAMGQVFDEIYPGLDLIKNMAGGKSNADIHELWNKWSKETDRAAEATFQLTGSQLKDIAENSNAMDQHITELLSTPEGQMEAIQSGNSLAALQIDELRQLRALMATSIQATTQMAMKEEKQDQHDAESWKNFVTGDKANEALKGQTTVKPDKF